MISLDFLRHLPVKRKVTFIVLTTCSVILLLACAGLFAFQLVLFKKTFARDLATLVRVVADNSTGAVSFGDKKAAAEILSTLTAQPHIASAQIELADGSELAAAGAVEARGSGTPRKFPEDVHYKGNDLLLSQPIALKNEHLGTLYVRANIHAMNHDLLMLYAVMLVLVLAGALLIALLLSARLQRFITEPILKLAETARIIAERGDYSVRAEILSRDEFGVFTGTFNQMLGRIESQDTALRASDLKFRQLAENIRDVFWIKAPDLKEVIYVSPAYQEVWGRSAEGLIQNPLQWAEAIVPEQRQQVLEAFQELATQRSQYEGDYRILRPDGTIRWIHDRGFQVLDQRGSVCRLAGVASDITGRKQAEAEVEQMHKQLRHASLQAGMAEVATSVLHNVGNVLNSVNVTAILLSDQIKKSRASDLARVVGLLREHSADLAAFLNTDPKGRKLIEFLAQLGDKFVGDQNRHLEELESLRKNIEHIKEIVAMQQNYATASGLTESVHVIDLIEDALRMNAGALVRHEVKVVREYAKVPLIITEKHKVLQILVNVVRNAKYACDESGRKDKQMIVRVANREGGVKISVIDNGVGIAPENLTRIFNHGFTTRKDGHGFGLHSGALTARELGGSLMGQSEGAGKGAVFTLELPLQSKAH